MNQPAALSQRAAVGRADQHGPGQKPLSAVRKTLRKTWCKQGFALKGQPLLKLSWLGRQLGPSKEIDHVFCNEAVRTDWDPGKHQMLPHRLIQMPFAEP